MGMSLGMSLAMGRRAGSTEGLALVARAEEGSEVGSEAAPTSPAGSGPAADPTQFESRDQIEERFTWDLSDMFAGDEAFLAAFEDARAFPGRFEAQRATAVATAEGLLAFMRLDDEVGVALSRLANYAERRHDEDTRVARYQDYSSKVTTLIVAVNQAASWFAPALLKLPDETVDAFYQAEPALAAYRRKIEKLRCMRDHVLPEEQEALLAAAGEMAAQPENVFSMLNDADLVFPDALDAQGAAHQVTHGSYIPLMLSPDRTLRENAYRSLYGVYRQFRNTSAAVLSSQAKQLKFFADARRYASEPGVPASLAASLAPTEVPARVYTNLIDSVRRNLGAMHAYVELRKRLLGLDELRFWDLYTPMVEDVDMHFTYEEACDVVLQALAPLGPGYLDIVREGLAQRWVDVYETPGKRSGAYSAGGYGMHPVILLNFHGTLDDVFTLVHEMGHSVHTYLACRAQPPAYSDYEMFVAEVASTCNECLLMQWFLDHAGEGVSETEALRRRAYLVNHFLETFRGTLYRQCMFAEFERDANGLADRGEGLTAEALCELYARLNRDYYGPGIVVDEEIGLEWSRIPHFYYDYYVYVYATSFSAAVALSRKILDAAAEGAAEGAKGIEVAGGAVTAPNQAVADYLGFLSGGSSKPPIELLRGAGVDMADPKPIDDALGLFASLVDEMGELADKLAAKAE